MVKQSVRFSNFNEELLEEFNKRTEAAFAYVYEKYYNELFHFTSKLFCENQTAPHDVLQDLFLKIWEGDKQFESFDFLKYYLYLSIRNRWKNDLEHKDTVQRYVDGQNADPTDDYILSNMIESETLALLHGQLKVLPPECAKVMRLSLQGHRNQEIADILSISVNTVYAQKQKALAILRSRISKEMLAVLLYFIVR
ncbi:MAG: sigma-70 family RNA polymerase sigma factor [Odoribacter sp.]